MSQRSNTRPWMIIALLVLITLINYIDRSAISFAMPDMVKDFSLNYAQTGIIMIAFGLGYLVSNFTSGILVDKWGAKLILTISIILWGLSMVGGGMAIGFMSAYMMRLLLGFAEGAGFPCMTKAISTSIDAEHRTKAFGFSLAAVPMALAIGSPIVSTLVSHFGWRSMFYVLAGVSVIWVPLWFFFFTETPRNNASQSSLQSAENHQPQPGRDLQQGVPIVDALKRSFQSPTLIANYIAFFVFGYYLFFFMSWLPIYLHHKYDLSLNNIGWMSLVIWLSASAAIVLNGYFGDWLYKKSGSLRVSRSYPMIVSQLAALVCIVPILISPSMTTVIIFITLAVTAFMSTNANYFAINIDVAEDISGTVQGVMSSFFALSGIIAPMLTGYIVSATGQFYYGFAVLIALSLLSIFMLLFFHCRETNVQPTSAESQSATREVTEQG